MNHTAQHVAALIADMFESSAAALRARGERADASLTDLAPQFVVSLEVSRDRGNWQRNLVVMVEETAGGARVDVKIVDDDQAPVARIASVEVRSDDDTAVTEA